MLIKISIIVNILICRIIILNKIEQTVLGKYTEKSCGNGDLLAEKMMIELGLLFLNLNYVKTQPPSSL